MSAPEQLTSVLAGGWWALAQGDPVPGDGGEAPGDGGEAQAELGLRLEALKLVCNVVLFDTGPGARTAPRQGCGGLRVRNTPPCRAVEHALLGVPGALMKPCDALRPRVYSVRCLAALPFMGCMRAGSSCVQAWLHACTTDLVCTQANLLEEGLFDQLCVLLHIVQSDQMLVLVLWTLGNLATDGLTASPSRCLLEEDLVDRFPWDRLWGCLESSTLQVQVRAVSPAGHYSQAGTFSAPARTLCPWLLCWSWPHAGVESARLCAGGVSPCPSQAASWLHGQSKAWSACLGHKQACCAPLRRPALTLATAAGAGPGAAAEPVPLHAAQRVPGPSGDPPGGNLG